MARRAKLRGAIEVLHHRFAVAIEMSKNFPIRNLTGHWLAIFVDKYGGHAHDVATRTSRIDLLNGVANRTGDSVLIIGTLLRTGLSQGSRYEGNRIVTAFTVTGIFNSLG